MCNRQLWCAGEVLNGMGSLEPRLASWNKSTDPAQQRLQAYLMQVMRALLPLPEPGDLYLDLTVDVQQEGRLARHYDVENYLTPLFGARWLDPARFVLVRGSKHVGGGSALRIGRAKRVERPLPVEGWGHFSRVPRGSPSSTAWKHNLKAALAAQVPASLPDGPIEVVLAWCGVSPRTWSALWKPSGDAMGPVLGYSNFPREFDPNDDRIVRLELHRVDDCSALRAVTVGMWWRLAAKRASASVSERGRVLSGTSPTVHRGGRTREPRSGTSGGECPAYFANDDAGYELWIREHREWGFVVNMTPSRSYRVLHRASCWTIDPTRGRRAVEAFTGRQYVKLCAVSIAGLLNELGSFRAQCRICDPDED